MIKGSSRCTVSCCLRNGTLKEGNNLLNYFPPLPNALYLRYLTMKRKEPQPWSQLSITTQNQSCLVLMDRLTASCCPGPLKH